MAFKALGLNDRLVQGILATGFTAPTEIQSRAIPAAVAGKDIIGCAQTGTGKTAAFTLPILNRLAERTAGSRHIRALVLTPTRELAQQIEDAVKQYGRFLSLRAYSVYGGTNIYNQLKQLSRGVDILIATPGRLIDHLERKSVNLAHVEVLVLDEADRMFDMGFIDDMRRIIKETPAERQTLLFSATMSSEVRKLVKDIQHSPELIEVGERRSPATTVTQHFYTIHEEKKLPLLLHILKEKSLDSVLVFSRTKAGAEKVSNALHKNGVKSVSIHSDRTQAQRQRALAGFKQGRYSVMVATDVAARGIDVEGISHVINYDIPTYAEDYIHRIGRTGRAQTTGDALTFVTRAEIHHVKKIERFIGKRIEIKKYPDFDPYAVPSIPAHQTTTEGQTPHQPAAATEAANEGHEPGNAPAPHPQRRHTPRSDRRTERPRHDRGERSSFRPRDEHRSFGRKEPSGRERGEHRGNERNDQRSFNRAPYGKSEGFKKRPFGDANRDRGFGNRTSFGSGGRDRKYERRDIFGPKKHSPFNAQKREHPVKKQEVYTETVSFGTPKNHGGPDWRELLPNESGFKKREHKVVKKMVSRKKKDS